MATRILLLLLPIFSMILVTRAATFNITNRCPYTVWAAASPGGGRRLDSGQSWSITAARETVQSRIWGRTNCSFDARGRGRCETGDCNGLLRCMGHGSPPNTLARFVLNQFNNLDFVDISNVEGFNIPLEFSPTTNVCAILRCTGRIKEECPAELRAPGGCNNPCTVYQTNEYCCTDGPGSCRATQLSKFFKDRCPDAYSYPQDDLTSAFTCQGGTNYRVVFCP